MNTTNNNFVIELSSVGKVFGGKDLNVRVLNEIDLTVSRGEMLAIIGRSGSGKSTLLHILGGLDRPTLGVVKIGGVNVNEITELERCRMRNEYLGFIYQFHHLLPEFSALENVAIPLLLGGSGVDEARTKARDMLRMVDLSNREQHRLAELSGGERQRVAIARALVTNPHCVLADEPTGNLDRGTAQRVYDLIFELRRNFNTAFVIVTHDVSIVENMTRVLELDSGTLIEF